MIVADRKNNIALKARLFRGFSDPSRLSIVEILRSGSATVGEIVERTSLSQSNVSNHLGCLKDCGLVASEQRGKFVHYRLSSNNIEKLMILADKLLHQVGKEIYECTRYDNS